MLEFAEGMEYIDEEVDVVGKVKDEGNMVGIVGICIPKDRGEVRENVGGAMVVSIGVEEEEVEVVDVEMDEEGVEEGVRVVGVRVGVRVGVSVVGVRDGKSE
jgi:hypothetical protein